MYSRQVCHAVSVVLSWMICFQAAIAKPAPQDAPPLSVTQQIARIQPGAAVEVRLKTKEKLHGRMGEVSAIGFALQITTNGIAANRTIPFQDVKSIHLDRKMSKPAKIFIYTLVGVLVGIAIAAVVIVRSID